MRLAPAGKGEKQPPGWDDTGAAAVGAFLYISQCLHQSWPVAADCLASTLLLWYADESCCSNGLSLALKLRDWEEANKQ